MPEVIVGSLVALACFQRSRATLASFWSRSSGVILASSSMRSCSAVGAILLSVAVGLTPESSRAPSWTHWRILSIEESARGRLLAFRGILRVVTSSTRRLSSGFPGTITSPDWEPFIIFWKVLRSNSPFMFFSL